MYIYIYLIKQNISFITNQLNFESMTGTTTINLRIHTIEFNCYGLLKN